MKEFASFCNRYLRSQRRYISQLGFTLPELLVIVGIVTVLISLAAVNLTSSHRATVVDTGITQIISDIKQQQLKAMVGDLDGGSVESNYGIHMGSSSYVLFKGSSYSASDSGNFTINLENTLQIGGTASDIVFTKISGDVMSYDSSHNAIHVTDTTSTSQKTLQFNQYGVITSVN